MHMPEAPMYEDHRPVPGEDQVGFTRQVFAMQPEPESSSVGGLPD